MKPDINLRKVSDEDAKYIDTLLTNPKFRNVSRITLEILYHRGIKTEDEIYKYLNDNMNHLSSPHEMKDSDKFCKIVNETIENDEDITFYTDYDMDGIGAGVTGVKGTRRYAQLKNSKSQINWYANNRFVEGYGITPDGVDDLMKKYPNTKLIITTDNGIVGYKGVQRAKDLGLKIIVTDHHAEGDTPVNADAIINPHQHDCNSTYKDLCGAGVIFKLLIKLYWDAMFDETEVYDLVDVVALSTVADLVPLTGDNRIIVKMGLRLVYEERNPVFKVLREVYNSRMKESYWIKKPNEETFGFIYGPALNSLGRMDGCIDTAMALFLETDETKMKYYADIIYDTNERRKLATADANSRVLEYCQSLYPDETTMPKILLLKDDLIPEGIVGLVAGYIKEVYNRPCIVFTKAHKKKIDENGNEFVEEIYKGSARSINNFNITDSFRANPTHILQFGGHSAAAGLSVNVNEFDNFSNDLIAYANKTITEKMLIRQIDVDFAISVLSLDKDFIDSLDATGPYGMGFERPKIGISDLIVSPNNYKVPDWESVFVGDGNTVRLVGQNYFTAVMFKHPQVFRDILDKTGYPDSLLLKPIGYPSVNIFNGREKIEFKIESNYLF